MSTPVHKLRTWADLVEHSHDMRSVHMRDLFQADPKRAQHYTQTVADLTVDLSKNRMTAQTITHLLDLAKHRHVPDAIDALFQGKRVNQSENRPALHTALRDPNPTPLLVDGQDIKPDIHRAQQQIENHCRRL